MQTIFTNIIEENFIKETKETPVTNNIKSSFSDDSLNQESVYNYKLLIDRKISFCGSNLSKPFKSNNGNRASELIKRLFSYKQKNCKKTDDVFFKDYLELYHLAKDQYKKIFTQEVNEKGECMLSFNKSIVRIIASERINQALVANNNTLCIKISNCILKEITSTGIDEADNIMSYLMLLEKNIHEGFTDYNINNKTETDFFDAYINKNLLLFVLFLYERGKEFHYMINSKYFSTNLNISKQNFAKDIISIFEEFINSSNYLLSEIIVNPNKIKGVNLSFIKKNRGYINKNIILSLLNMHELDRKDYSFCIQPETLLSIIENSPERYFFELPWCYRSLQIILRLFSDPLADSSEGVLEHINSITNKSKKQHKYLVLCKLLNFIDINKLTHDINFMHIKSQFTALFNLLIEENFKKNNLPIKLLIANIIMPVLLDFNNEIILFNSFPVNLIINHNIIFNLLIKLEKKPAEYLFFIKKYNFTIIQFIVYAINSENETLKKQAIKSYSNYLELDTIKNSINYHHATQLSCDFSKKVAWGLDDSGKYYIIFNNK